jgi:hypothetical protein
MKLMPSVWRTAWYEEGLSERFVQEMTRLEKSFAQDVKTSAEWVEQLVIELGQLTQNMIYLEGELPRPHQLKLAFERALKLSALSAHLMTALDRAIDHGPAVLRYAEGSGEAVPLSAAHHVAPPVPSPVPHVEPPRMETSAVGTPAHTSPAPEVAAPARPVDPRMRTSAQAQIGLQRQSAPQASSSGDGRSGAKPAGMFSNLMDMSQPMQEGSPSPMREMILALSRRGLSRSEIEVITEQPRHIIEAVLQHGG